MGHNILALIIIPLLYIYIPGLILYYVIKLATKDAIRELKNEDENN